MTVQEQARTAKQASYRLLSADRASKDRALAAVRESLSANGDRVFEANARDLRRAEQSGLQGPLLGRLRFDEKKMGQILRGIRDLEGLDDPVGRTVFATELDHGLTLYRETTPIGLIGVIFESRPDALVQIATLCLKSGNAVILKGGSEARDTNRALFSLLEEAAGGADPRFRGALQLVETHGDIRELLELDTLVDLMIPRGSADLVRRIKESTKIPVLGHADGICHVYVDAEADIDSAVEITRDAKCQYPAVCNAVETLLVHEDVSEGFLTRLAPRMTDVELRGDERARRITPMREATEKDWRTEYNELILAVRVVSSFREAVDHINAYGSHHTDAIVTTNPITAESFMRQVDSGSVMWNCSTRFADGYRYGFGAEVGISTSKIHARGPVGLEGLTIYKYKLRGGGQTVEPYADGKRRFTHRPLDRD